MNSSTVVSTILCKRIFSAMFSGYNAFCGKRASHRMAKRLRASFQFGSKPHFFETFRKAKYSNFMAASSVGNDPRVLMTLRNVMCRDSTALVV